MQLSELSVYDTFFFYVSGVVFIAGIIRGFSGFGFSAFVILLLSFFVSPVQILPFIVCLDGSLGFYLFFKNLKNVSWRQVALLIPGIILITPISMYFLKIIPLKEARIAVAVSVILLCLASWCLRRVSIENKRKSVTLISMGMISGFFSGLVSMGGIPAAMSLMWVNKNVRSIRATIITILFFIDFNSIFVVWQYDLFYPNLFSLALCSIPMAGAGIWLGAIGFQKFGLKYYRQCTFVLFISIAAFSLLRSLGVFP